LPVCVTVHHKERQHEGGKLLEMICSFLALAKDEPPEEAREKITANKTCSRNKPK